VNVLAVFIGGLLGAGLRIGIDALLPHPADAFPWPTLLINVAGSFVLGVLVARVWPVAPDWLRHGLGTGLLGTFTTFSAVVVSVLWLASTAPLLAVAYLLASVAFGIAAAALGLRLGRHRTGAAT
jgi:fluoride exporter